MQLSLAMYETGAGTHVGKVRERNEDRFLTQPETGLWAIADGMGGHEDGDYASQVIVNSLSEIRATSTAAELLARCEEQIAAANGRLRTISRERGGAIVGATVAVLLALEQYYACVWSGDSRIYMVRDEVISQLSRDHTEVQRLLSEGAITLEEANVWRGANPITRAIGVFDKPELELTSGPLQAGDAFVICSDGLTHHVSDEEILRYVSSANPQQACDNLIALTLERGAVDNVTVVIVRYQPNSEAADPGSSRYDRSEWRG